MSALTFNCPICNLIVHSLQEINEHLDSAHSEEEEELDLLAALFKKTSTFIAKKASQVISADSPSIEFELNPNRKHVLLNFYKIPAHLADSFNCIDLVKKTSWQKSGDACTTLDCRKPLGIKNGSVNCTMSVFNNSRCGKLYCDRCCSFQMKINPKTMKNDPENGLWYRVCATCATIKDESLTIRSRTSEFTQLRKKRIDKSTGRAFQLLSRLEKLISQLQQLQSMDLVKIQGITSVTIEIERSVAFWEDDNLFSCCPICGTKFSFLKRKHHCRLCGTVMCGYCSMIMSVFSKNNSLISEFKTCYECHTIVSRHRSHELECPSIHLLSIERDFNSLQQKIQESLLKYNKILITVRKSKVDIYSDEYQFALKCRKELLDLLSLLDSLSLVFD